MCHIKRTQRLIICCSRPWHFTSVYPIPIYIYRKRCIQLVRCPNTIIVRGQLRIQQVKANIKGVNQHGRHTMFIATFSLSLHNLTCAISQLSDLLISKYAIHRPVVGLNQLWNLQISGGKWWIWSHFLSELDWLISWVSLLDNVWALSSPSLSTHQQTLSYISYLYLHTSKHCLISHISTYTQANIVLYLMSLPTYQQTLSYISYLYPYTSKHSHNVLYLISLPIHKQT